MTHSDFLQKTFSQYISNPASAKDIDPVGYRPGRRIAVCPEPRTFLKKLEDAGNRKSECRRLFQQLIPQFKEVDLSRAPGGLWFNTTKNGINLRLGVEDSSGHPVPIRMGDVSVHGLIAGQTGSGKSVLLHNLIFNTLAEYAPWELDLYLADFKRVEFSKYMNGETQTPHICACAATGEIRYVLSLIEYLVDCMNAREDFFKRMGVAKIAQFRDMYPDVVMPRILLIVDEFQQLFLEASIKENEKIHQMLTAIVKKGRATGLHILFASQEMSGTLSRSDLSNFRLRIALNCSSAVSSDVLGNRAAARIKRGTVLANTSDGSEATNQQFTVPYIETDEKPDSNERSYFDEYLLSLGMLSQQMHYEKNHKFYQEDMQEPIRKLERVLDQIKDYRKNLYRDNKYFEALTLGSYVTFSNLRYDIQTLFIERGRNKNILAVSSMAEDIAYLQKLLSLNFTTSPRAEATGQDYQHIIYSLQPAVHSLFQLEHALPGAKVYTDPEDILKLEEEFSRMMLLEPILRSASTPLEFLMTNLRQNIHRLRRKMSAAQLEQLQSQMMSRIMEEFGNLLLEEIPQHCERILETETDPQIRQLAKNLQTFYDFRQTPQFPPKVFWINGVDMLERLPDWLLRMMKNGMNYNVMFVFMATSEFDQMMQIERHCDYLFLGGNNVRIYDRLRVNYSHKEPDSIVLDLHIKSESEDRSFKKYKCSFGRRRAPMIPFDEILT